VASWLSTSRMLNLRWPSTILSGLRRKRMLPTWRRWEAKWQLALDEQNAELMMAFYDSVWAAKEETASRSRGNGGRMAAGA